MYDTYYESAKSIVENFANECIDCGLCAKTDCGNYGTGASLGVVATSMLNEEQEFIHFPFTCALCNKCTVKCPKNLVASNLSRALRTMRLYNDEALISQFRHFRCDMRYNHFSLMQSFMAGDVQKWQAYTDKSDETFDELAKSTAFFPGCSIASFNPELTDTVFSWLVEVGVASKCVKYCCGAAFLISGFVKEFEKYKMKLCEFLKKQGIKRLILGCPHCKYEFENYFGDAIKDFELIPITKILIENNKLPHDVKSITVHDACYDRFQKIYADDVRKLFSLCSIHPMQDELENTICCGGGGMVSAYAPDYCTYRRQKRFNQIDAVCSNFQNSSSPLDACVSTCFSCVNSLHRQKGSVPVTHYLEEIFGIYTDWEEIDVIVNAMYMDSKVNELLSCDNPMFD
ncbi:MAG: (Fe-S)-binding protein [Coriobacteriales bacterium]|nr:(Fe-S)-binding protein [Coriobacteriales bacterium]